MARVALDAGGPPRCRFAMSLKFVCLNLWYGGKLLDNMLAFLRREKPDILAAQEAYNSRDPAVPLNYRSIEVLADALDFPHVSFAPAFRDDRPEGAFECGNAVFSRFPIREARTIFFDVPYRIRKESEDHPDFSYTPRNLQRVALDVGGKATNVFNTQGIWGVEGDDTDRRLAMSDVIVREVAGKSHVILAGDFNVREETQTIRNIEAHLTNVFKGELKTSFNLRHKAHPGFASAVVDMVFVSPDIRVLGHSVPDDDVSDHLPLVCKFEVV